MFWRNKISKTVTLHRICTWCRPSPEQNHGNLLQ